MPTYGYKCEKCENDFEVIQGINDEQVMECPDCGGSTNRVFYPVGIIFKGSGFHITDYCRPKESGKESGKEKDKSAEPKKEPAKAPEASKKDKDTS